MPLYPQDPTSSLVIAEDGTVIDCDVAMANLFSFIDAELDVSELEEMRGHIDDCPECLYEEELGRKLKGVIQRTCVERAPDELRDRVVARLAELRETSEVA